MARSTRLLIALVLAAALVAWWVSRRSSGVGDGGEREPERESESPAVDSAAGSPGRAREFPSLPDEAPVEEVPLEDRSLGTPAPVLPAEPAGSAIRVPPPPEPPRASVDPEEREPDDPADFQLPAPAPASGPAPN